MPVVVIILLALLGLCLLVFFVGFLGAFYSPLPGQNNIRSFPSTEQYNERKEHMLFLVDRLDAVPYEAVSVTSRDGLRLAGRYYHVRDGAPLAICFHGWRATAVRDFSGGGYALLHSGQNVLLVDQRAQGRSEGHVITFGVKERFDCVDWCAWACERFGADAPILLYGISMGAATVLMASGLDLPANVRGIVADCPYSAPEEIIRAVCRSVHLPDRLLYPFADLSARLLGGFRLSDGDAARAVRDAKVPILILHGEDDRFVPCEMSAQIQAMRPDLVRRETFPGAGHGLSALVDPLRYEKCVRTFIADALQGVK